MIGTLLDDLNTDMPFETIKERFATLEVGHLALSQTLKNAVSALAGAEREIPAGDLEVGILEDRGDRRTFARLDDDEVGRLLA